MFRAVICYVICILAEYQNEETVHDRDTSFKPLAAIRFADVEREG
jgi:hypothetical protein